MSDFNCTKYETCQEAVSAIGLLVSDAELREDACEYSHLYRTPTVKHPKKHNGWFLWKAPGRFYCGNWETSKRGCFLSNARRSSKEEAEIFKRLEEDKEKSKELEAERARQSSAFWEKCRKIDRNNPHKYLIRKRINPVSTIRETTAAEIKDAFGFTQKGMETGRFLAVPLRYHEKIVSFEFISEEKSDNKYTLHGGKKRGCYWRTPKVENPKYIAVAEGVATILSVLQHFPSKNQIQGYAAMGCGNLVEVTKTLRQMYPEAKIIICSDKDKNGIGEKKASEAQRSISGESCVVVPRFSKNGIKYYKFIKKTDSNPTDWNDFFLIHDKAKTLKEPTREKLVRLLTPADDLIKQMQRSSFHRYLCSDPPGYFELQPDRLLFFQQDTKGQLKEIEVCGYLKVASYCDTKSGTEAGKVLEWRDRKGNPQQKIVKNSQILNDIKTIQGQLADRGLQINLRQGGYLQSYLHLVAPTKETLIVKKLGWESLPGSDRYFYVLPCEIVGEDSSKVILDNMRISNMGWIKPKGTLVEWQEQIAKPALASDRCIFAMSIVFAAPLMALSLLNGSRFFEFYGESSVGKTFTLRIAQSILGYREQIPIWNVTDAGLEMAALAHNDNTMFLDELGAVDVKDILRHIYRVTDGTGKQRSSIALDAKPVETWRTLGLSAGEVDLKELATELGLQVKGGQDVRFVAISAAAGQYGIFDKIPDGYSSIEELLSKISTSLQNQYGTAFPEWIKRLQALRCSQDDVLTKEINKQIESFVKEACDGKWDNKQIRRVCRTFGLAAVAGNMASGGELFSMGGQESINITGWQRNEAGKPGDAWRAALNCFVVWAAWYEKTRLTSSQREVIDRANRIFTAKSGKFCALSDPNPPQGYLGWTGYDKEGDPCYFIETDIYEQVIGDGRSARIVDGILGDAGYIIRSGYTGVNIHPKVLGGKKRPYVRIIKVPQPTKTSMGNPEKNPC